MNAHSAGSASWSSPWAAPASPSPTALRSWPSTTWCCHWMVGAVVIVIKSCLCHSFVIFEYCVCHVLLAPMAYHDMVLGLDGRDAFAIFMLCTCFFMSGLCNLCLVFLSNAIVSNVCCFCLMYAVCRCLQGRAAGASTQATAPSPSSTWRQRSSRLLALRGTPQAAGQVRPQVLGRQSVDIHVNILLIDVVHQVTHWRIWLARP